MRAPSFALALALVSALILAAGPGRALADAPASSEPAALVARALARARDEVARGVAYDGAYRTVTFKDGRDTGRFAYPGGDVDPALGVCTDVVVRGLSAAGIDLQSAVHDDVVKARAAYAAYVKTPDANIDHRRVGPLMTYFQRHARALPRAAATAPDRATFRAGDIVVWTFGGSPSGYPNHVGLVSDRIGPRGLPLVVHNLGPRPTEDDTLDAWMLLGHYRVF